MTKCVSLVIAETGTRWTDCVRAWRSTENELVVLIQQHDEPHLEFQLRVAERVERLQGPAVRLDQILLVVGSCQQDQCRLHREDLLHAVLANIDGQAEIARVDRVEGSAIFPLQQDALGPTCSQCSDIARSQTELSVLSHSAYLEGRPREHEELA